MKRIIIAATLLAGACATQTPEEACTSQGFGPESGQFWTCMSYKQNAEVIEMQKRALMAGAFSAVKPQTCSYWAGGSQCW